MYVPLGSGGILGASYEEGIELNERSVIGFG